MVTLSRIYTKTGDQGETSLGDGRRVAKDHHRVTAYGEVDELNAVLGLFLANCPDSPFCPVVRRIQNDLFDVGADLCVPLPDAADSANNPDSAQANASTDAALRVIPGQVERLEREIDRWNESLKPLNSFVLPGGTVSAGWLHLARTVCRRAERAVVTLMRSDRVNPQVLIYLNRLSDLLFVLARVANDHGQADVLWRPGAGRTAEDPKT
ncbi:MAG: cob(I)yrinic acid a,c-diamide adenosyltransferase [Gemmataceae bacterium]|nr:cob(I)yrinic acid a,c-diamide adenosyltransferase [Gemmataceae bacterium]